MEFRYSSVKIAEIVKARKVVREGQSVSFQEYGQHSMRLTLDLELTAGALVDLRLNVTAGRYKDPTTYDGALILGGQRVRGIGYSAISRKYFYKERIPQGWHENVMDPNLPTQSPDYSRHRPLPDFGATDLEDFLHKVCNHWNIEVPSGRRLL